MLPFINLRSKLLFRQKLGNLKHPQPCEFFQVWVIQTNRLSVCVQYMLDEAQVAVYVIMGEIRPVVEPDHDPVGGLQ